LAIWLALWGTWFFVALRARLRLRAMGWSFERGIVEVCIAGVLTILVNAYFDPTLESAQVAFWLWTLVGLTLGIIAVSRRATETVSATTQDATAAIGTPRRPMLSLSRNHR
jgi:ABC-type antimicrobial peptide transport system permease subunit